MAQILIPKDAYTIPLFSKKYPGKFAIADRADMDFLSRYTWRYWKSRVTQTEYARARVGDGEPEPYMHRYLIDVPLSVKVDHINNNGLDNRRLNLRVATIAENNANRRGWGKHPYKGVRKRGNKWQAAIRKDGKHIYLGTFKTIEEAAIAYDTAAKDLFGEFANLNFPVAKAAA